MLQIISGKFFKKRHSFEAKGILFSNYSSIIPIKTRIATLFPVDVHGSVASYVMEYINQIEDEPEPKGFSILRIGDSEIVKQFKNLCSFGLKAYFDIENSNVQILCRKDKRASNEYLPSQYVRRILDYKIDANRTEIDNFINFIDKIIGLPRDMYNIILNCISSFESALKVLDENFNLSYSMIVYCLETLSQNFDGFSPKWEDYDQNQRINLEKCFENINSTKIDEIKNVLITDKQLKLTKRFVDFIVNYVDNDFFTIESDNAHSSIKKSQLRQLLINAYNTRSGYVHTLKPVLRQITMPDIAKKDVFYWEHEPYLTYAGLVRLAHHVINNFVMKQETVESENINWRSELPGMTSLNIAPQYWIWKHEGVTQEASTIKLEGFLCQLFSPNPILTDIRELLKKYEELIPSASQKYKIRMLVVYYLYNTFVSEEYRLSNYMNFTEKHKRYFDICCVENMLIYILTNQKWPWLDKECEETITSYMKNRYKKNNLKLPDKAELLIWLTLANVYNSNNQYEKQCKWLEVARYDSSGNKQIQDDIKESIDKKEKFDIDKLMVL